MRKQYIIEELDLRWGKTDYSQFLNETEIDSFCGDYNSLINFCHKSLISELDWWFSPVSARNNFGSPLFHHFLCFQICLKLVKAQSVPKFCLTDSNSIFLGLLKLKSSGLWDGEIIHTRRRSRFAMFIKLTRSFISVSCHTFLPLILLKFVFKNRKLNKNFVTLVDTFLLPGREFNDRYFCGINEFLSNEELEQVRFVPTFSGYRLSDYFQAVRKIRRKPEKFLLKEDFITLGDALQSLLHAFRLFWLKTPELKVSIFDLGTQLREELRRFGGLEDGVHGFINYNFAKRLSTEGFKIRTVVDWYENHGRDRGWNYGFHRFHPNINTIGYNMVFLSKWHLASSPLPLERENKVLPEKILTPCRSLIEFIKKNDPLINVKTTGSFRFPIPKKSIPSKGLFRILVPLSFKPDAVPNSVKNVRDLCNEISKSSNLDFHIRFKPHPAITMNELERLKLNPSLFNEIWTSKPLCDELQTADLVLGEWTFSLLESLNAGVPVGVIRSSDGLFHSSIPNLYANLFTLNIDSLHSLNELIKIALNKESNGIHFKGTLLEPPSRILAQEAFGLISKE